MASAAQFLKSILSGIGVGGQIERAAELLDDLSSTACLILSPNRGGTVADGNITMAQQCRTRDSIDFASRDEPFFDRRQKRIDPRSFRQNRRQNFSPGFRSHSLPARKKFFIHISAIQL